MDFQTAAGAYFAAPNPGTLRKVCAELRAEMTLNEKIGMLSGSGFFARNGFDLLTKGRKYNYRPCMTRGVKRLGVPPVAFSDGPRGVVMGSATCFPVPMARAASFDPGLEYSIGLAEAEEVLALGGNYFAGICINLLRNPRWGRAQESYGEDPFLLGQMGAALTKAVQEKGVIACPKHYACNSIENLRFSVDVHVDEKTLQEVYLPHFRKCVDAGAMSIMGAYNLVRGDHCCESRYLLTDVLRGQWGFQGFTISDFLMGVYDGAKALKAGLDIEMPQTRKYLFLKTYLKQGKIAESDIDNAVEHILAGLIKITPRAKPTPKSVCASAEHTRLARRAAEEGTVLLKNDGILPLKKGCKVAIVGRYADKMNVGDHGSSSVNGPYNVTPYRGLCNLVGKQNVVLAEGLNPESKMEKIRACDAVVVCVGSDYKQEGENLANFSRNDNVQENSSGGDRYSLRIPKAEVALIRRICASCDNVIVNIIGGSAYIIEEWKDRVRAVLESFYCGMEGGNALAAILFGDVNPSGHLPFTMAKDENDYPPFLFPGDRRDDIEYGYYHGYTLLDKEGKEPAYPFGFGLSYTTFELADPVVKERGDTVTVAVRVKNTGPVAGKAVVQVYAGAVGGDHPVKLLKGFSKQVLEPGEEKSVKLQIFKDDLKFYDENAKAWYLEDGYTFYIGFDSRDAMRRPVTLTLQKEGE